jgi:phosphohistidine phosphatase
MKLYLVRHAIAEDSGAGKNDAERALTEAGKERMARATAGLRKLNMQPALILTSPLRRARETAEILADGLGGVEVEFVPELSPGGELAAIVALLRKQSRHPEIALVGHQPGLGQLASLLLSGAERRCEFDFKKGGVACLEMDFASGHASPGSVLKWFIGPRVLRGR